MGFLYLIIGIIGWSILLTQGDTAATKIVNTSGSTRKSLSGSIPYFFHSLECIFYEQEVGSTGLIMNGVFKLKNKI